VRGVPGGKSRRGQPDEETIIAIIIIFMYGGGARGSVKTRGKKSSWSKAGTGEREYCNGGGSYRGRSDLATKLSQRYAQKGNNRSSTDNAKKERSLMQRSSNQSHRVPHCKKGEVGSLVNMEK